MTRSAWLPILFGLFTASVVMTNAMSALLIEVGPFVFVAGTLLYPLTFLLTDAISEVYGKERATQAVWTGFTAQALAIGAIHWVSIWPTIEPDVADSWRRVFLPLWRIALASMVAYLISQLIDVRIFHWLKKRTEGRHLWLRNNVSTIASQCVDTAVFVLIAFVGVLPARVLIAMFFGQWLAKALMALADTPFCYLAVSFLRTRPVALQPPTLDADNDHA